MSMLWHLVKAEMAFIIFFFNLQIINPLNQ